MKASKKILIILLIVFASGGFLLAQPVFAADTCTAQNSAGTGIFNDIGKCQKCGDCSLCDFLTLAVNISRWILSVMGGLAMVYFIWFGIGFIMSFGNAEKVAENKKAVIGAVVGILIIIAAWTLVNFIFISFVQNSDTTSDAVAVSVWGTIPWSTLGGMCP
ncbi:MAG: pilin [bacterium]